MFALDAYVKRILCQTDMDPPNLQLFVVTADREGLLVGYIDHSTR